MQENSKQTYFASANTARGFVSYFEQCFAHARIARLYMIKGGPGTGKSRFLGDVAHAAVLRGWHAEYYACSSDPHSLDGVILTHPGGERIALADATPPHVMEPMLPGVRDVIVNLGDFWNRERLAKDATRIRVLSGYKQACFDRSYDYLRAAGSLLAVRDSLIAPCVDADRFARVVAKLTKRLGQGAPERGGAERLGLCDCIGMHGQVHLGTYEQAAERLVVLQPFYGMELRVMQAIYEEAHCRGCRLWRAPHVLLPDKTAALYFPDTRLCMTVHPVQAAPGQEVHTVDLRRLCNPDALRGVRGEARLAGRLADSAIDAAAESFARAGEYHFELESLYTAAMDFAAKERFTATFCDAILQKP